MGSGKLKGIEVVKVVIERGFFLWVRRTEGESECLCTKKILSGDVEIYIHFWGYVEMKSAGALCVHQVHHYVIFLYETNWSGTGELSSA